MISRPESDWDCKVGTPDEDHEFVINGADDSETGEVMNLRCKYCDKEIPYDGRFDGDPDDDYDGEY